MCPPTRPTPRRLRLGFLVLVLLAQISASAAIADRFDFPIGTRARYTPASDGDGWYVAQGFGEWNATYSLYHLGEDWNLESGGDSDCGSTVYSIANGTIVHADIARGWGRVLIVRHTLEDATQVESLYAHLDSFAKTSGDVSRGEVLGSIGDGHEGATTYPCHLHLEIRTSSCPHWGAPGPGYTLDSRASGWAVPSDFIATHQYTDNKPENAPLNWAWRTDSPGQLNRLVYTHHGFVGVGPGGAVVTSTDGATWVPRDSQTHADLNDVAFGHNVLVAVGGYNDSTFPYEITTEGVILSSPNGVTWTPCTPPNTPYLSTLAYNGSTFVAASAACWTNFNQTPGPWLGTAAVTLTSQDGLLWTPREFMYPRFVPKRIATFQKRFVMTGYINPYSDSSPMKSLLFTSPDGVVWDQTYQDLPPDFRYDDVCSGQTECVVTGSRGYSSDQTPVILRSTDGLHFTQCAERSACMYSLTYAANRYVGFDTCSSGSPLLWWSQDGREWHTAQITLRGDTTFQAVGVAAYGNGLLVALGNSLYPMYSLYSSADLNTFSRVTETRFPNIFSLICSSVVHGHSGYVAIAGQYSYTSLHGMTWNAHALPANCSPRNRIVYGNGKYIAACSPGAVVWSGDGIVWHKVANATPPYVEHLVHGNGSFVALGTDDAGVDYMTTSTDGVHWSDVVSLPLGPHESVVSAALANNLLLLTVRREVWNERDLYFAFTYSPERGWAIAALNHAPIFAVSDIDRFLGTMYSGEGLAVSPDGLTWTPLSVTSDVCATCRRYSAEHWTRFGLPVYKDGLYRLLANCGPETFVLSSQTADVWDVQRVPQYMDAMASQLVSANRSNLLVFGDYSPSGSVVLHGSTYTSPLVSPMIYRQPEATIAQAAETCALTVLAEGWPSVRYQWHKDGIDIAGATNHVLQLTNIVVGDAAAYTATVYNSVGSVTSTAAYLAVLGDPADGRSPNRLTYAAVADRPSGKQNLVLVTHGWCIDIPLISDEPPLTIPWLDECAAEIRAYLMGRGLNDWDVRAHLWPANAFTDSPESAAVNAAREGGSVGRAIARQGWQHVHLIANSAGAALIQSATEMIKALDPTIDVHETFLDPYLRVGWPGRSEYGRSADWADCYFAHDFLTDDLGRFLLVPSLTEGRLEHAYAVNVTRLDPLAIVVPAYCGDLLDPLRLCGVEVCSRHEWPHEFYLRTVSGDQPEWESLGFQMSKEGGGWSARGSFAPGNEPRVLGMEGMVVQREISVVLNAALELGELVSRASTLGAVELVQRGFWAMTGALGGGSPKVEPMGGGGTGPVWISFAVPVSNQVSFVTFDLQFTSTNDAGGLFSVYWGTNMIGTLDERVVVPGQRRYSFALPEVTQPGLYTLGFRLDAESGVQSGVAVTNVVMGYSGQAEAIRLQIADSGTAERSESIRLTAAPGLYYQLQSSTNLTGWAPVALVFNTNGTVQIRDPATNRSSHRFYRAVLP